MSDLHHVRDLALKISQVRRRQLIQGWLQQLPYHAVAAIVLTAVWYVIQPYVGISLTWVEALAIFCALGLVSSGLAAVLRRPTRVDSALAFDSAFGLRERVTTSVSLTEEQRTSAAGIALLDDTRSRIASVVVAERFPIALPRTLWAVPAAALALTALVVFYDPSIKPILPPGAGNQDQAKVDQPPVVIPDEVKQNNQERKKRIKELGSEKFDQLQADLDRLLEKVDQNSEPAEKQLAIQELSKLLGDMRDRQKELGKMSDLQKHLRSNSDLKNTKEGMTKELQQALSKGDMEKAREELAKMAQAIKDGKLTDEQKKELAKQLADLQRKLKDIAELKQRRDNIAKSDLDPETKRKELEKIDKEAQKLQDLAKLSEQLKQCQQCLEKGDPQAMSKALEDAAKLLESMQQDALEAAELELAMEDMEKLKQCLG